MHFIKTSKTCIATVSYGIYCSQLDGLVAMEHVHSITMGACVIVAVRLSKALKDAHGAHKGVTQSALRAARFY